MIVQVKLDAVVEQQIDELRMNHVDAYLVIEEELDQMLSPYIKEIVGELYGRSIQ